MTNLKDILDEYKDQTRQLSNVARQLAFAGGGIIWLFRGDTSLILPGILLLSLIFIIAFFVCDLLQYIVACSKLNGTIENCLEDTKNLPSGEVSTVPYEKNKKDLSWSQRFFWIKMLFLIISFVLLIVHYLIIWLCNHRVLDDI